MKDLTQERLKQLLHYDPATGLFTWRVGRRGPNARAGNTAGVSRVMGYQRWVANITVGGERHYLGCFTAPEEAHQAYLSAKARLHPFQTIAVKAA